ncbi:MAG: ATP-dependent DNA helicase RecG [Candidatus Cloacimonetes bacterium]|nr:ATP-dependent DNA helicase RecG [Candidatus Cloacimonadota bacterium]
MSYSPDDSIQYVRGVGPKRAKYFKKLGIETVKDILFYYPRDYLSTVTDKSISELKINETVSLKAKVTSKNNVYRKYRKSIFQVVVSDGTGYIYCIWFNASKWLREQFEEGKEIIVRGKLQFYGKKLSIIHPDVEFLNKEKKRSFWSERDYLPVYNLTEGLSNKLLRKVIHNIFERGFEIEETLPEYLREQQNLLPVYKALELIHMPSSQQDIKRARRRFVFEELFFVELMLARKKKDWSRKKGNSLVLKKTLTTQLKNKLPFALTFAQKKVIREIVDDMKSPYQMNRLLQGDVGSGKTIVAIFAMLLAVENGFQAAIMAPTEILAQQHYLSLKDYLKNFDVKLSLLLGGNYKDKKKILKNIKSGKCDIIVGTHSLIQKNVEFDSLGLIVIDEQHRFGVMQRKTLIQKGQTPDKLVMSATPIPRSLALTIYGDLEVSVIDELPPNRKTVYTNWINSDKREEVIDFLQKKIEEGRQVFIVCPLVEESEKSDLKAATSTYKKLKQGTFSEFEVDLLHGKMKNEKKDKIMHEFSRGNIDVLVATTVIEVGIDVPNATIMMIEHAERFGLSQLHQLRGRVGRGKYKSYCVLVAYEPISETGLKRLNTMRKTNDGFEIAEVDLEIRGPGEFFGTEQSGIPHFKIANIIRDKEILEEAREYAFYIIDKDYELISEKNKELRKKYRQNYLEKEKLFSF